MPSSPQTCLLNHLRGRNSFRPLPVDKFSSTLSHESACLTFFGRGPCTLQGLRRQAALQGPVDWTPWRLHADFTHCRPMLAQTRPQEIKYFSYKGQKRTFHSFSKGPVAHYPKDTATWSIFYGFLLGFRNLMCCGEKNILEVSDSPWNMHTWLFHQVKVFLLGLCSFYVPS